jgi:hypothetical protein
MENKPMDTAPITLARLYLPLTLSLCCAVVLCRTLTLKGQRRIVTKVKPFGDFVEHSVEISSIFVTRTLLILGTFALLTPYSFYDYSTFFPRYYQMEVFFDERGIAQSLGTFSYAEIQSLSMAPAPQRYQEQYFQQVDSQIQNTFGNRAFFSIKDGYVHSVGQAQIVPEKIDGWQNYHVKFSDGELTHVLEIPNTPPQQFYSRFEKLPSEDDYIGLSFADLFVRHHIMLRTKYKQILVQNNMSEGFVFKLTVVGITKLNIFPWPRVSNTVYLADFGNAGLVPVAYAIYR